MTDPAATIPEVTHHRVGLNGTDLHYVSAGDTGSPVLLVHGFPESWWAYSRLIPLLARRHRVYAVDLRGFGDSGHDPAAAYGSEVTAEDLHQLVAHLDVGPVHLQCQDVSGSSVARLAAAHPEQIASLTLTETGFAGYGLEALGDVTRGGAWHIGMLAADGIPELLLTGRERELLGGWAFPAMTRVPGAVTAADLDELVRVYAQPGGWLGAAGLYRSLLADGDQLRALLATPPLTVPVATVTSSGDRLAGAAAAAVTRGEATAVSIEGAGHYLAMEAPRRLADAMLAFLSASG